MEEYDVYIPLVMNDGTPVPSDKIGAVKSEIKTRFGGFTFFPQAAEGEWRVGKATFRDRMVIIRVLAEAGDGAAGYFADLKDRLKKGLRQKDLLIVRRSVETV
jgi:hypothetical protein